MKRKIIVFGAVLAAFLMLMIPSVLSTDVEDTKRIETIEEETEDIALLNSGGKLGWEYGYIFIGCRMKVWLPESEATEMISALKKGIIGAASVQRKLHDWFPDMDVAWSWGYYFAIAAQKDIILQTNQVDDIERANGDNGVVFQCNLNWLDYPTFFSFSDIRSQ